MKTLRTLPAVVALAEEQAREAHYAWNAAVLRRPGPLFLNQETVATRERIGIQEETEAHLDLLCDLSRPASLSAIGVLVAAARGFPPPTGGAFWRFESWDGGCLLELYGANIVSYELFASESVEVRQTVEADLILPSMADATTFAQAVEAVALAVLGGPRG